MTLVIDAADVARVLDMPRCIEAMEQAFAEEARGIAVNHPRQRYRVPPAAELNQPAYWTNLIAGAVPSMGVGVRQICRCRCG